MLSSTRVLGRLGRGISQRLIVTEASLGLTHVIGELRERQERGSSVEKMLLPSLTASAGRGLVLSSDLTRASDMVAGEEGLTVFKELLLKFIELNKENKLVLINGQHHLLKYYQLCHILCCGQAALAVWKAEGAKELHALKSPLAASLHLTLLNCLFREEMDAEVVEVYRDLQPMLVNQRAPTDRLLISLALLALCRLSPDSGYQEGEQLVRGYLEHQSSQGAETLGRASFALSWLAIRAGKYGAAHGSLPLGGQRRRLLSLNLELATLCNLNRLEEAMELLESLIGGEDVPEGVKLRLSREAVKLLVEKVGGSSNENLTARLRNLFRRLDSSAEIVEQSLLDLLLHPIQWEERVERRPVSDLTSLNRQYRRQKQ